MNRKQFPVFILLLACMALLLAACSSGLALGASTTATPAAPVSSKGSSSVEGRIMPKTYATLSFATNGEITSLPIPEGVDVSQGAVLVSLGKREPLEAAQASARLAQLSAQQGLDRLNRQAGLARSEAEQEMRKAEQAAIDAKKAFSDLDTDAYKNTLDDKEKAVQTAKDKLKDNNDTLDKYLNLDQDNQTRKDAQTAVDNAQKDYDAAIRDRDAWKNSKDKVIADLDQANANLADKQHDYDNRKDGPDKDQLAMAQAELDNATAEVKSAERALNNMDLTAPFAGTLTDLNNLTVGQWVSAGRTAVTLADFSEWYVETKDLTELDVVDVSEGQKASVKADALADVTFAGQVVSIKKAYTERSGDVLYTVRVKLDKGDPKLRWGMTVQVSFEK